ncbi:hypothetical protein F5984_17220 [Rudanella paleaurantiibacter]|uniref:DUF11 domain-containing protein n=1 Tax=Rudanella paleaurantiibacter TaxID=2614655 RepID=A0A7J5TXJ1_9BACT|nr:DUF11 domain-containing protein [Rudanella paleaurantiibacter]KAB7729364.1 hypothetical protein F5984_17220 [Rudanella paleaurantiibacter]
MEMVDMLRMYSLFFLCLLLHIKQSNGQSTYYLSSTGRDSNNGLTIDSPFQTLDRINSVILKPGDKVLFRRGDIFRGTLRIQQSGTAVNPIIFDAYGSGEKPTIAASTTLSGWTQVSGNIWQASCPSCNSVVSGVFMDGSPLPLGRFPDLDDQNRGYLTVLSHEGKTKFLSRESLAESWVGAEVVIRPTQFILDRAVVTQQSGNSITIANNSVYDLADGFGFFFQNHPATLSKDGEWYYNPSNKSILILDTKGKVKSSTVTATAQPGAVIGSNISYVNIQNIKVIEALNTNLSFAFVSNLNVNNVDILNAGEDAVGFYGTGSNVVFEDNLIHRANNNAIDIIDYSNSVFRRNVVRDIGSQAGRGKSGDGQYRGITSFSTRGISISENLVDSIGYSGITFLGNSTIQRNVVSNFCLTKSDGGGLYTVNESNVSTVKSIVTANVVKSGIGAIAGQPANLGGAANGIYLDDCTRSIEVTNNTVYSCNGLGIYLHATNSVSVVNNTSYDNNEQFVIYHNFGRCPARSNIVQGNIFVAKNVSQGVARYETISNDLGNYGTFDNNYYARPFDDAIKILVGYSINNNQVTSYLSLAEWQRLLGKDTNSKESPRIYAPFTLNQIIGQPRLYSSFDNDVSGWYPTSYYNNGQASYDNTGKIDGGTLRVDFPSPSGQQGSYSFIYNGIGSVVKGKSYLLKLDAVANSSNKAVQVFIRQRNAPYNDLDERYSFIVNNVRGRFEVAFTAKYDESDAIVMIRVAEDGQVLWLDNISFQEAEITKVDADKYIKLLVNPSRNDTEFNSNGSFVDVAGKAYSGLVGIPSLSSLLLFRTELTPVDVSLSLQAAKRSIKPNELVQYTLSVKANSTMPNSISVPVTWSASLPNNLQFVNGSGISFSSGNIRSDLTYLNSGSTKNFTFTLRPLVDGIYRLSAQVATSNFLDPDSEPSSGTEDGEDDSATEEVRTFQTTSSSPVFVSPNLIQRPLPPPFKAEVTPSPDKADLSLYMVYGKMDAKVNDIISCTLTVNNAGGRDVNTVQIQKILPTGLSFLDGEGWFVEAGILKNNLGVIRSNSTRVINFRVKAAQTGYWSSNAQIATTDVPDSDSVPGNGFLNGEDDQARVEVRVR